MKDAERQATQIPKQKKKTNKKQTNKQNKKTNCPLTGTRS
jgi:hypothetical protein